MKLNHRKDSWEHNMRGSVFLSGLCPVPHHYVMGSWWNSGLRSSTRASEQDRKEARDLILSVRPGHGTSLGGVSFCGYRRDIWLRRRFNPILNDSYTKSGRC